VSVNPWLTFPALFAILLTLHLLGVISWDWWAIAMPLLFPLWIGGPVILMAGVGHLWQWLCHRDASPALDPSPCPAATPTPPALSVVAGSVPSVTVSQGKRQRLCRLFHLE
jgi:hypothetical protein